MIVNSKYSQASRSAISDQRGQFHLVVVLLLVVAVVATSGMMVYRRSHAASKVTDAATRAKLQQVSADLKKVNLGTVKQTVDAVNNVQASYNYKKSNNQ